MPVTWRGYISMPYSARDAVPDLATMQHVAAIFQVLADVTRARIVAALTAEELCVCDVATVGAIDQRRQSPVEAAA